MNTNMTVFRWFQKSMCVCALEESSLSTGRIKGVQGCSEWVSDSGQGVKGQGSGGTT